MSRSHSKGVLFIPTNLFYTKLSYLCHYSTSGCITACSLTLVLHFINKKIFSSAKSVHFFSYRFFPTVWNRCSFQIKLRVHTVMERGKYFVLYINHTDNGTLN